ncbi:MAG: B12-binding domain-containing radical SAM protein [bacterium]
MITLINPNLILQQNDIFTTGVVYMPVGLASFAGALRASGLDCTVVDAFGERPNQYRKEGDWGIRGLTADEVCDRIASDSRVLVVYASNVTYHRSCAEIVKSARKRFPAASIVVMENTQAVTAYSLRHVQDEFYDLGADYVITGESEQRGVALVTALCNGGVNGKLDLDGIGCRDQGARVYSPPTSQIENLDELAFPAWDLFPLGNYWHLKYAHGPFETDKYLPLLTSRGCPYQCRFCVIPETNSVKWRARSARNVVDEMAAHVQKHGVREFHLEDVDPTVNEARTREICEEILRRGLKVIWKICSGTKVETIREESTIELMAEAGCRYISISPETGSPRVLKAINKPFNLDHAVKMIQKMNDVGIHSQACFVLGFPQEDDDDRRMTWDMVQNLTKVGLDEVALFVITPVPGSAIHEQFSGYTDYSQLNFSPAWREDWDKLSKFRLDLYKHFLLWKLRYHPLKIGRQTINFMMKRFETKMEMTPYRACHTYLIKSGWAGGQNGR